MVASVSDSNDLGGAFAAVGLDPQLAGAISAASSLSQAIDQFSSSQVSAAAITQQSKAVVSPATTNTNANPRRFEPSSGVWEAVHYANDLISHQPKYKFLFKVSLVGFPSGDSDHFVTRCDKPKIQLNHTDVNYYNFRTKVLTSVTMGPMSMTFLDEIGDSVNYFFAEYMKQVSGQAQGYTGIDNGSSTSSSSKPYKSAASVGKAIIIQQIFGNGTADNKFTFKNPRIESFDFDELSMEDSTSGSTMSITFNYDALECSSGGGQPLYTWGATDIGAGGGSSNFANGGGETPQYDVVRGSFGSPMSGRSSVTRQRTSDMTGQFGAGGVPTALADLMGDYNTDGPFQQYAVGSSDSILDRGIQSTFDNIRSGFNMSYGGALEEGLNRAGGLANQLGLGSEFSDINGSLGGAREALSGVISEVAGPVAGVIDDARFVVRETISEVSSTVSSTVSNAVSSLFG